MPTPRWMTQKPERDGLEIGDFVLDRYSGDQGEVIAFDPNRNWMVHIRWDFQIRGVPSTGWRDITDLEFT